MTKYPFLNLSDANAPYIDEIRQSVERVIGSGRFVGGEEVERFEEMISRHAMTPHAVGVSNGLDALRLIFRALVLLGRLQKGDEVIVPANTYIASVLAITDAGLSPVLAEPSIETLNLDTSRLEEYLTPRTKAIMTVHLYGRACYDSRLHDFAQRHNLIVVEDNAQAIGAEAEQKGMSGSTRTGGLAMAAAFSFYPTKNIGAIGDAGAVTTHDSQIADTVRALANYGADRRYHNIYEGFNCRLDPIQAAVIAAKLPHLEEETAYRETIADIYSSAISNPSLTLPRRPGSGRHVWHQYVIMTDERDRFREELAKRGVATDIHYATPPHRQPALTRYSSLSLPVTDKIANSVISLPITRTTKPEDAAAIASIINGINQELLTSVN